MRDVRDESCRARTEEERVLLGVFGLGDAGFVDGVDHQRVEELEQRVFMSVSQALSRERSSR
jgi:hypothetical protein